MTKTDEIMIDGGYLWSAVAKVPNIKENEIENAPVFGTNVNTGFMLGIGKVNDEVKILLDIDEVLTSIEIAMLEDLGNK